MSALAPLRDSGRESVAAPSLTTSPPLEQAEFAAIAQMVEAEARIHLPPTKLTLVHSRLCRRLRERGIATFAEYVRVLRNDPVERQAMIVSLTTNHTHFFRENHHFDHLRAEAAPDLRRESMHRPVRLWSAGCSSGEEVYSMALTLAGADRSSADWLMQGKVRLLATDLSPPMVASVAEGLYSDETLRPVPVDLRGAWFCPEGGGARVADQLRAIVAPKVLNLFAPWPIKQKFDVIFCRNVMIYFEDDAKAELEARLVAQLAPGGYLYIGHSERLIGEAADQMTSCGHTIYRKRPEAS